MRLPSFFSFFFFVGLMLLARRLAPHKERAKSPLDMLLLKFFVMFCIVPSSHLVSGLGLKFNCVNFLNFYFHMTTFRTESNSAWRPPVTA